MGSKPSKPTRLPKTRCLTFVKTKVVPTPRIPQEIIDEILDHLATDSDFNFRSLQLCALVSKSWVPPCRRRLFHIVLFASKDMARWFKIFPVPEECPAHNVRDLRFSVKEDGDVPEKFFKYTPWFTNVKKVTFFGYSRSQPLCIPPLRGLPQSVNSLAINADMVSRRQIRDVMEWLPDLDNLSLSGSLVAMDEEALLGVGAVLRGKFGGKLSLFLSETRAGVTDVAVMDILLEPSTRLHFTDVQIRTQYEYLLPTVRLAEACTETLVKLLYIVDIHRKSHSFSRFWHGKY